MQSICFHHNDMDGYCSAAIVRKAVPEAQCVDMVIGKAFPVERILTGAVVYIVDYSPESIEVFEEILQKASRVIWIDHHKTAIEKFDSISTRIEGVRVNGIAACELCWRFFFPNNNIPAIVKYVGDYDVWRFSYPETKEVFLGLSALIDGPTNIYWRDLLNFDNKTSLTLRTIIYENGRAIKKYVDTRNKSILNTCGVEVTFEGHKVICCNAPLSNSWLFDSYEGDAKLFMVWFQTDSCVVVRLYNSSGIDATEIVKKYGGGGHPGACGFDCEGLDLIAEDGGMLKIEVSAIKKEENI